MAPAGINRKIQIGTPVAKIIAAIVFVDCHFYRSLLFRCCCEVIFVVGAVAAISASPAPSIFAVINLFDAVSFVHMTYIYIYQCFFLSTIFYMMSYNRQKRCVNYALSCIF